MCLLSYELVAQCGLAQWRREPHFILLTHISESAFCPKSFHGAYIFRANSKLFYLNSVLFMVLQSWPLTPNLSSHLFFPPNDTGAITPHTHTENGPFNICVLSHISSSENTQTQEHNTMRTPVWTELENGMKIKLHRALVVPWGRVCDLSPGLELNHPRNVLPRVMSGSLEVKTCWGFCEGAYTTLLCDISESAIIS